MRTARSMLLWFVLVLLVVSACAQESEFLEANYTKKEYQIPMRDGAKLFTSVFFPKDQSVKYPILINRTPYDVAPYGDNRFPDKYTREWKHLAEEGFIFVFQDVRGKFMSEGDYENMRPYIKDKSSPNDVDESSDTHDTIDWLIKNIPGHNGKVGLWGISYPGFYAAMSLNESHPALVAVSPQAPIADWFIGDDFHHHGAVWLPHAFNFMAVFDVPRDSLTKSWPPRFDHKTPDGYRFFLKMGPLANTNKLYFRNEHPFWNDFMEHPNYDAFWQARSSLNHFEHVKPAVLVVGGWFDAENLFGALNTYKTIEKKNPDANNVFVMGPWYHGGWVRSDGDSLGNICFGSKTGAYYIENIELPFFKHYLKGEGDINLPEAQVFETGSNQWRSYESWPPKNAEKAKLYLRAEGSISMEKPAKSGKNRYDEYVSNPSKPVPFTAEIATGMPRTYMVEDQRFASTRPDVLVYESEILQEDVTVAGPLFPELYVSTSGTDCDWIVKLIDVYPDTLKETVPGGCNVKMGGFQMLVRGDVMRSRYRNSFEKPEPMQPNTVTKIKWETPDINHAFLKGHKIMIQIQSSWFPLVDRNPQKYVNIYQAVEDDFQKAVQRIYHSSEYPSSINVSLMK